MASVRVPNPPVCRLAGFNSSAHREETSAHPDSASTIPEPPRDLQYYAESWIASNIPAVIQDVLAWTSDKPLQLDTTGTGPLGKHLGASGVSSTPNLEGAEGIDPKTGQYDRYRDLSDEEIQGLVQDFEKGKMPNINQVRLL